MNDYERIARIIRYLNEHYTEQPTLETLAREAGLSSFHFHRLFASWAGVTPKDFVQCLTIAHARRLLHQGENVLDTALDTGLSGPGRLHDLCVTLEAVSPGELKSGGAGSTITYGTTDTPFGKCLVGRTPRGLCHLAFLDASNRSSPKSEIAATWPRARLVADNAAAEAATGDLFQSGRKKQTKAWVRGTNFQLRVWRALLEVPRGCLVSYGQLASAIGDPRAARAVGSAVGANPLAYLIPCHRVIRETGVLGDYRWGRERKGALVAWETLKNNC